MFWNFLTSKFFLNFGENKNNAVSQKLQGFEQSYLQAKFAIPESILTEPHNRVVNINLGEIFYI